MAYGLSGDTCSSNAECDDSNVCNGTETCDILSGNCQPDTPLNCDDGADCSKDSCNPSTGCIHTPVHATCNDGVSCTNPDVCDPTNPLADGDGCVITPVNSKCNDNDVCTADTCDPPAGCVYTSITCNNNGACDPACNEDCNTCPADCPCPACTTCNTSTGVCDPDCPDGTCDAVSGEDCNTCPGDCPCPNPCLPCDPGTGVCGTPIAGCCCGDGICENDCNGVVGEDQCRCWEDCADPPDEDCNQNGLCDVSEAVRCRTFCVKCVPPAPAPCSTGVGWSVGVTWSGPKFVALSCGPVGIGGSGADLAAALVGCLQNRVCDSITIESYTPVCFRVTVRGTTLPQVCVGPVNVDPTSPCLDCCCSGGGSLDVPLGPCPFNPYLIEVLLSDEDCNSNGIDDAIDIALETSQDVDDNGIPDECEVAPIPTVSEWELMVMTLLALTAGAVLFGRRRRPAEGS